MPAEGDYRIITKGGVYRVERFSPGLWIWSRLRWEPLRHLVGYGFAGADYEVADFASALDAQRAIEMDKLERRRAGEDWVEVSMAVGAVDPVVETISE